MIKITRGDDVTIVLTAKNGEGVAVDLTGATFTTYVKSETGDTVSFANSKHTADPDQVANLGKFRLQLESTDTERLAPGEGKEILTKIVQSARSVYFHGRKILTVLPNQPIA